MITVVLADDQAMIRQAFTALLQLEPDIRVVGQAGDVAETVRKVEETSPEVVLLDVQMPSPEDLGADGIDACAVIMAARPETRVIILTTFGRPGYLRRAMEAGAVGYMVKDAPAEQLIEGIRRVHQGLRVVDPSLAAASLSIGASPLTARELEVLVAASSGGVDQRHREQAVPVRGHRPQPPVVGHGQARRRQPGRGRPDRHRERLAGVGTPSKPLPRIGP